MRGCGGSTKGNVVRQFWGLTEKELPALAEVNPEKFRCFTACTHILVISEQESRAMKPDYYPVLPWHFEESILRRKKEFLNAGGKMVLPFPEVEMV